MNVMLSIESFKSGYRKHQSTVGPRREFFEMAGHTTYSSLSSFDGRVGVFDAMDRCIWPQERFASNLSVNGRVPKLHTLSQRLRMVYIMAMVICPQH